MDPHNIAAQFDDLTDRYDALHRPGAALQLEEQHCLGSGPFTDRLNTSELKELNEELAERIAAQQ